MKFFIYIILVFSIPTVVSAQVPGYQGKRLSVEGDFFFMSALFNPNQNAKPVSSDSTNINGNGGYYSSNTNEGGLSFGKVKYKSFNTRYNVNISYVISRDMSVELTGGILNTGWNHQFTKAIPDPYSGYSPTMYKFSDLYKVQSKMIGINFKFFRKNKGAIAPNGSYFKLGGSFIMNTPTYLGAYENTGYGKSTDRANTTNMVLFTCGLGKQTIFYKRFIFRYGIEFGMSPTVLGSLAKAMFKPDNSYYDGGSTGNSLNERILYANLVNINLGLGIILF